MNKYLRISEKLLLLFTPLLASTVLAALPSRAATVAFSSTEVVFTDFNQSPRDVFTNTDTNTIAISKGGSVTTSANAFAFLSQNPPLGFNFSTSIGKGQNGKYFGLAESEAAIKGIFEIPENTLFSFDFITNLLLTTSIDEPEVENAQASGEISFALIDVDTNNLLDFFSLAGNLTTESDQDYIKYNNSDNIVLSNAAIDNNYAGNEEFIKALIEGSVQLYFTNKKNIALVEVKRNLVKVEAPEPSICLGFVCGGVFGILLKRKHQKISPHK